MAGRALSLGSPAAPSCGSLSARSCLGVSASSGTACPTVAAMAFKSDQVELPLLEGNVNSSTWPVKAPGHGSEWPHEERKAVLCSQLKSELLLTSQQSLQQQERHSTCEDVEDEFDPAGCTSASNVGGPAPVHGSLGISSVNDASAHPLSWSVAWKRLLDGSIHLPRAFVVVEDEAKRDSTMPKLSGTRALRFQDILSWVYGFLKRQLDDVFDNPKLVWLATKAGFAASLISFVCLLDGVEWMASLGIWAVVTVDLVFESNIGTSLQKGVNRTIGTLCAGVVALFVSHFIDTLPPAAAPVAAVLFVFLGGAIPMFYRFRPPFKDRWNYAVSMIMITFHMLLLSNYHLPFGNLWLPTARFTMIIVGFLVASAVNLALWPIYAGDNLHSLASKNLEAAATVLEKCVCLYAQGAVLDQVPNIASGNASNDDKVYELYHEIVMSNAEVDRLVAAVAWEPPHGKFFKGYPWHLYQELLNALRYLVYDIIALDSCVRAEIQAPAYLRSVVEEELKAIGTLCADALRLFASDLRKFEWSYPHHTLKGAELAALQLQHKLSKHLSTSLRHGFGAPAQALGMPELLSSPGVLQRLARSSRQESLVASKPRGGARERGSGGEGEEEDNEEDEVDTQYSSVPPSLPQSFSVLGFVSEPAGDLDTPSSVRPSLNGSSVVGAARNGAQGTPVVATPMLSRRPSYANDGRRGARGSQAARGSQGAGDSQNGHMLPVTQEERERERGSEGGVPGTRAGAESSQKLMVMEWVQRQESVGRNWDRTLETITALSLVKFSSLLLEVVAKMTFVIERGERLALLARFDMDGASPEEPLGS